MVALVFLAALIVFHLASAHSNIGYPLPYNKISCKASAPWCKSACPPIWGHPSTSPKKPAAIWKRGQTVQITWHKNNHIGGFYRRSLVVSLRQKRSEFYRLNVLTYIASLLSTCGSMLGIRRLRSITDVGRRARSNAVVVLCAGMTSTLEHTATTLGYQTYTQTEITCSHKYGMAASIGRGRGPSTQTILVVASFPSVEAQSCAASIQQHGRVMHGLVARVPLERCNAVVNHARRTKLWIPFPTSLRTTNGLLCIFLHLAEK